MLVKTVLESPYKVLQDTWKVTIIKQLLQFLNIVQV